MGNLHVIPEGYEFSVNSLNKGGTYVELDVFDEKGGDGILDGKGRDARREENFEIHLSDEISGAGELDGIFRSRDESIVIKLNLVDTG